MSEGHFECSESHPSPCDICEKDQSTCLGCNAWLESYQERQRWINIYAQIISRKGPQPIDVNHFCYLHPDEYRYWLRHGPCMKCECERNCNVPCRGYLQWWNTRMKYFRKLLYEGRRTRNLLAQHTSMT